MQPEDNAAPDAESWEFATDRVEATLYRSGGQLAPVRFHTTRGVIQPFAIAPWSEEALPKDTEPVLRKLRGDFFCMPFGENQLPWQGENHPAHGETAGSSWTLISCESTPTGAECIARLHTSVRGGDVTKRILLRSGETNVYCRHELNGFTGPVSLGHHAMLGFPEANGPGQVLLSPWHHGQVCPRRFQCPETGGYSSLETGATFRDLKQVPLAEGGFADLSEYPAREGFDDLVMVSSRTRSPELAWSTVTFPEAGWLWFGLKDPRMLASTILWHSNGGRHYAPWNGRHRRVLALEEVTAWFHFGLAESAEDNPLARSGIPTVRHLSPDRTTTINYVMGVVALPSKFDRLKRVEVRDNHLAFTAESGVQVNHPVDLSFLRSSAPATASKGR